jgi:hypothetical protein
VWFNFSRWGVGLFDLCENRHPIEVAGHFPVMTFQPPMMQFSYCFPLRLSPWTHVTYGASCLVVNPCFFVIRHLILTFLVCSVYTHPVVFICLARPAACIPYILLYPLEMTPFFSLQHLLIYLCMSLYVKISSLPCEDSSKITVLITM